MITSCPISFSTNSSFPVFLRTATFSPAFHTSTSRPSFVNTESLNVGFVVRNITIFSFLFSKTVTPLKIPVSMSVSPNFSVSIFVLLYVSIAQAAPLHLNRKRGIGKAKCTCRYKSLPCRPSARITIKCMAIFPRGALVIIFFVKLHYADRAATFKYQ